MFSYQTGKHNSRASTNSNRQKSYSNDNSREYKHHNYKNLPQNQTTQGQPQRSQFQFGYGDREFQRHFQNHDHQNQSFRQHNRDRHFDRKPETNDEMPHSTNTIANNIDTKFYTCPGCKSQFDYRNRFGRYTGKLPLILNCKHTVCQECIHKGAVEDNIVCPICKNPSALIDKNYMDNLHEAFSPNYYIFGMISFSKGTSYNSERLSLVPVQESRRNNFGSLVEKKQIQQRCCFLSCNNEAKLRCEDCNDVYCTDCSTVIHKSAKSLWTHKQVPITLEKPTRELERCTLHEMDIEFFCKNCDQGSCCYCFIEKHTGHEKDNLSKLSEEDMSNFEANKQKAQRIFKQLLISQRRIRDLHSFTTSASEKKICNYFVNLHAKIHSIEKNLRKDVVSFHDVGSTSHVEDEIIVSINTSVDYIKNLLVDCDCLNTKKLNLKRLIQDLEDSLSTPCYLLSENKSLDPIQFQVDPILDRIEEYFHIRKFDAAGFSLVSEDKLPPDYEKDPEELQYESDVENCLGSIFSSSKPGGQKRKNTNKQMVPVGKAFEKVFGKSEKFDNELVEVTHIESLECFYVQLKRLQFNLRQMNKDINNYVKLAGMVIRPQLNELYLAQYITKKDKMWCRGRLVEIKNGETEPLYEIFFIDYGSTQTLDITKLREITTLIAQQKPFAIQCELYNPTYASWRKHAHVYMGKMINGKDVYMLLKDRKNSIFMVDLMVSSSDGGLTSLIDILIHTCSDSLNRSCDSSTSSQMASFVPEHKIYGNSQEFKKNQTENVTIAKIIDPHHIYIHMAVHAESIKKMINSLRLEYRNSSNHGCIPIEGTYVVVEHKDPIRGNWHRALIKKVYINNERVNVLLVDWGANITVPWSSVRMLKENFTKLESQAILVKLAHIEPHESTMVWSENASLFLQRFFQSQEVLKMIVHNVEPLEVALFEILNNMDICVNALLVKKNYAESTGKISETVEWPKNDQQPEGFTKEEGFVAGLLEKVEESDDDDDDSDNEDKSVVKQKVDIMKIVSPDLIYIKFVCRENQEQTMHKELQIHYYKERKTKESWESAEECVVNYSNHYTRGKILSQEENNKYRVNLFDRVEEVVLPLSDIFIYTTYFKKYSSFVYKSHLANIKPAGGEKWSLSSIEALERIFDKYKDIYATKVQGDTTSMSIPMHMWYTRIKVGGALEANMVKFISINNKLMKLGFASKQLVKTEVVPQPCTSTDAASKLMESLCLLPDDSTNSGTDSTTHIESTEVGTVIEHNSSNDKNLSTSSEKSNSSIPTDWNELIDEEENKHGESLVQTVEEEIKDWLPAFSIDKKEFNAWITCAETEGILYLREDSLQQVYKEMENNINENFKKKSRKPDLSYKWEPGHLCTIHYKGSYYRGKVYKVTPECITAVMIDFGSDHELKCKDLYREILYPKIPAFASKVKLDKVYAKSGKWLSSDYENLLDIVTEYGKIIINGSLDDEIPLAEVFTDSGVNINQALVQKCPNLTRSLTVEESVDDDVVIEKEESVYDTEIGEIKEKLTNEVDNLHSFKFESLPEKCMEEKSSMSVAWVLTYNTVVIRKPIVDEDEDLLYLSEQIQDLWKDQPVLDKIDVGMPCIAPYSEDGIWYRAQVYNIDGLDCGFVFVIFVDFGNVESVNAKDLRQMRPEWFEFTVPCHIAAINVELKTENHVEYVFQHMRKIHGKNKLVEVVSKNPLVIHIFNDNSEFAYQPLIDNGLLKVKSD